MTYKAFISYNRSDRRWAEWLHRKLETYRTPRSVQLPEGSPRRLYPVFRDRDELTASADLKESLVRALDQSEWLIVVCSSRSASSRWVGEEITRFIDSDRRHRILLFIVDRTSEPSKDWLHPVLAVDRDGNPMPEPLAADATEEGDGRDAALLKVIAAMLGIGFGQLLQRDQKRRRRRATITIASLLAGAGLATATGLELNRRRHQAEDHLARVQVEKRKSDEMLNVLSELEHDARDEGKLLQIEKALAGSESYFAALPESEKTPDIMKRLGEIANERGQLLHLLGKNEEAVHAIRRSLTILDLQRSARGESYELARCRHLLLLSNLLTYTGNAEESKALSFELANTAIPALRERSGDSDPIWCHLMLLQSDSRTKEAMMRGAHREALELADRAASEASAWWDHNRDQPNEAKYLIPAELLSVSVRKMMLAIFLSDKPAFDAANQQALHWYQVGVARNPHDGHYALYGAVLFGHRGDWSFLAKDFPAALAEYERSVALLEEAYKNGLSPQLAPYAVWHAIGYFRLAAAQAKTGNGLGDPKSAESFNKGREIVQNLAKKKQLEQGFVELVLNTIEHVTTRGIREGVISKQEEFAFRLFAAELRALAKPKDAPPK